MTDQRTEILLLWDMARSTKLLVDVRPDRYDLMASGMKEVVNKAANDYGGVFLRDTGDGGWTSFTSAQRAIDGAVAMLQRARHVVGGLNRDVAPIRIVLTAGDIRISPNGERNGIAINMAARIEARDDLEGDILSTSTVVELARHWGGHEAEYLGAVELRSIPGLVHIHRIQWQRSPIAERLGLPQSLSSDGRHRFVGRQRELDRLTSTWEQISDSGARLVSIIGGAGFGKTRLCGELARRVRARHGVVLMGRCDEYTGYAYEPYVQAIESYVDAATNLTLDLGPYASELSRIVPTIGERLPELEEPPSLDAERARYRLFEAVVGWLGLVATEAPALLVLDDFTWATEATARLTVHLANSLGSYPVMVLLTSRSGEATPACRMVDDVLSHRIELGGFDEHELIDYANEVAGEKLDLAARATVGSLGEATGGNPFMVAELLPAALEGSLSVSANPTRGVLSSAVGDIPPPVRSIVLNRVGALSEDARQFLRLAALAGERFDPRVVQRVLGLDTYGKVLAEAESADLVRFDRGGGEFAHSIVRDVILHDHSGPERSETHRRIGEAIEEVHSRHLSRHYESLAYQFSQCLSEGERDKAIEYAELAARSAIDRLAHDQAAAGYRLALRLRLRTDLWSIEHRASEFDRSSSLSRLQSVTASELAEDPDLRQQLVDRLVDDDGLLDIFFKMAGEVADLQDDLLERLAGSAPSYRRSICQSMVELGRTLKWAGKSEFRTVLRFAAREALRLQSTSERGPAADLCANALLADTRGIFTYAGRTDATRVNLLDQARMLPIGLVKSTLLQANLAAELPFSRSDRHLELSTEAVEQARTLVEDLDETATDEEIRLARTTLARVLNLHVVCLWRPDRIDDRLELCPELLELSQSLHRPSLTLQATTSYFQAVMEGGQFEKAPQLLETIRQTASDLRQPLTVGYAQLRQANWAAVQGQLEKSNGFALDAFETARSANQPDAEAFYAGQQFLIMLHRGQLPDVVDQLDSMANRYPSIGAFRAALAFAWVEAGERQKAEAVFRALMADLDDITFDLNWLLAMALAAYPAWFLQDHDGAAILLEKLRPYSHRFVDIASGFYGSVLHYEALLLDGMGRWSDADHVFTEAVEAHRRIPSPPWEARTLLDWGCSLARRGEPLEINGALEKLDRAAAVADRAGLAALAVRIERTRPPIQRSDSTDWRV